MNSTFDLTKEISQLPAINNGVIRPQIMEVSSQKSNTGTAFSTGLQSYKFNVSAGTWWSPKHSYFALRCNITDSTGALLADPSIAVNMGMISNLFQSMEFRMGGKTVQRVTQFVPQVDALIHRSTKSKPWMDSLGEATNFWSNDSAVRISEVSATEGVGGRRVYSFDLIYRPPLMVFHSFEGSLPSGNYEIVLQPKPRLSFKLGVVETTYGPLLPRTTPAVPGVDYDFSVEKLQLKVATLVGPRVDNGSYAISLDHIECQSNKITSKDLSQNYFSVSPATKALAVAYQDDRADTGEVSASRFSVQSPDQNLPNDSSANLALSLTRFYLQYAGVQRPSPDADPDYVSGVVDRTVERYYETYTECGMLTDTAGPETLEEWQQRGPYLWLNYPRDSRDGSTRVQVNQEFSDNAITTNGNILLFGISETSVKVTIADGNIIDIQQVER